MAEQNTVMKVLIIEDDLYIREGLADIIRSEGYECIVADNGSEGLLKYQQHTPQLILLDIMMPDQDGYSVCREIRKNDLDTAIIFISAKSEEIDRVLGLELGADDYIMKPFGKHEVTARVRAVTRRYLMASQAASKHEDSNQQAPSLINKPEDALFFKLADLTVNMTQLRAERKSTVIDLSLRDCKTLQLLHAKKNQVITRDELFNYCWGRDYLPNSRTLDQHISKLRKAIEMDSKNPVIIKTVHGVGYRYETP